MAATISMPNETRAREPKDAEITPAQRDGLASVWQQARDVWKSHPRLMASWASVAAVLTLADAAALALEAWSGDREAAQRAIPGTVAALGVMHADVFLRLSANASDPAAAPFETLGMPTVLTLVRRTIAGFLWGHLAGGRPVASRSGLQALMILGGASDVLDGALARHDGRTTRLGAYLDAEADFSFWAALALTLGERKVLPRWLIGMLFSRFVVPAACAGVSYCGLHRRVTVASTIVGKVAAVAQFAMCGAALARRPDSRRMGRAYAALTGITAALMVASPLAQALRMLGPARGTRRAG